MVQIIIVYFFVLILFAISIAGRNKQRYVDRYNITSILIGVILVLFACFRNGNDPDYNNYVSYYNNILDNVEYSFSVIVNISKNTYDSPLTMFFIYALLSVTIRYVAIKRYANYFILSLAVYIATFYILHDMIQIRAAVSSAILLLSLSSVYEKKYLHFAGYIVAALCFHTSSIVFIPVIFLFQNKFNRVIWISIYSVVIAFNLLQIDLGLFVLDIFNTVSGYIVDERVLYYITRNNIETSAANVFSPYALLITLLALFFILSAHKIQNKYKYGYLLIKIQLIGTFLYLLQIPGISVRLSELYLSVSSILLYPNIVNVLPSRYSAFGKVAVAIISLGIMTFYIFNQKYMC